MAKPSITDEERQKLAEKLDSDLNDFIKEKSSTFRNKHQNDPEEDEQSLDELVAELKQHPAFMTEFDPSAEMSPAMEGLQKMKYESESTYDNADGYKDDGNNNFKIKKYRWAVDSYSSGIKQKAPDKLINAVLYCNRAAAQYHLGNHRSSFMDCIISRKFKPDHLKAILRGCQCCIEIKRYEDAMKWCDDGLILSPKDDKFIELRSKADKLKRQQDRDKRRELVRERKENEEQESLVRTIEERGVRLSTVLPEGKALKSPSLLLSSLESHHPSGAKVRLDNNGTLSWPVLFVYPECSQTDYIESFCENSRFLDHLDVMFGSQVEPPPWDTDNKYKPQNIEIYFEEQDTESLYHIDKAATLLDALKHKRYTVHGGTPTFIIIVEESAFAKIFLSKYKIS